MTTHSIHFGRKPSHSGTNGKPGVGSTSIPMPHHHTRSPVARPAKFGDHYVKVKPQSTGTEEHDKLVDQTKKWVAQTFYGELMKQMRNSPFKSKMMSGGRGGEAFGAMFDQKLAEKMANGSGSKLVDAIVNHIEANKAYGGPKSVPVHHNAVKRPGPSPTLAKNESAGLH